MFDCHFCFVLEGVVYLASGLMLVCEEMVHFFCGLFVFGGEVFFSRFIH